MPSTQQQIPAPQEGFLGAQFITTRDIPRAAAFYRDVLGGEVVFQGEPTFVKVANTWVIIDAGGGPTDDKPDVILEPPNDAHKATNFLVLFVADIQSAYRDWTKKGATFLTPPTPRPGGIRCYMRDADGYLIQVAQLKLPT